MQPYPNPNYYAQYMQYSQPNPYLDRIGQLQQFQQTINPAPHTAQQFQPLGKIVESIDVVKATDIPMDGTTYYFPKGDGSEVYSKQWLPNGTTRIMAFKPIIDVDMTEISSEPKEDVYGAIKDVLGGIQSEMKTISEKIDKMSKPTRAKKEIAEDE